MFGSFARAALWAATVAGVVELIGPGTPQALTAWSPSFSLAGGFVFGVGAALNGGCSLSTVQRLIDGELSTLATLVGLAAGSHSARRSSPAVAFPLSPCPLRRG